MPKLTVSFLQAFNGDCIFVSFQDNENITRNILIDGGTGNTYQNAKSAKGKKEDGPLKQLVDNLTAKGERVDLLILTHIDDDHIGGILRWFSLDANASITVKEVWYNGGREIAEYLETEGNEELELLINPEDGTLTSFQQGINFAELLEKNSIWNKAVFKQGDEIDWHGLSFKILSPSMDKLSNLIQNWRKKKPDFFTAAKSNDYRISLTDHIANDIFEEDKSVSNGSSIGFLITYKNSTFAFLGDAHPKDLLAGLAVWEITPEKPVSAQLVKISHHGSAGNTSRELLRCFNCQDFIILTDGEIHQHPDKQMLSRLIDEKEDIVIHFNYTERFKIIFSKDDYQNFKKFKPVGITNPFVLHYEQ